MSFIFYPAACGPKGHGSGYLWQRVGRDCRREHPRALALRWLWKEEAVGAVVEFLEDTRVGCRVSSGRARVDEDRDGEEVPGQESEED